MTPSEPQDLTTVTMEVNGVRRLPGGQLAVDLVAQGAMSGPTAAPPSVPGIIPVPHTIPVEGEPPQIGALVDVTYRLRPVE